MNHEEAAKEWDLVIKPKNSLFELNLKDVWRYRDLLVMLVKRDFISSFKQTILGPLWFFIQPLFTTIIFTFVFGRLANISTDGIPRPLFYMAGVTAWNYFADCLNKTSNVFSANANLFGKVYFPRLVVPIGIIISNLMRFLMQILMFVVLLIYYSVEKGFQLEIGFNLLWFPFLVIIMALLGLGMGMIVSAFTTKYKDLQYLMQFAVTMLMYATPIIYPLSAAPAEYRYLIELNPMTSIIETFRYAFLGQGLHSWFGILYSSIFTLVALLIGVVVFNRTERTFIDTI